VASKLSISRAWDETREIFRRDGGLLVSVALALIVLPEIIVGIIAPQVPGAELPGWTGWLRLAAGLIALAGQLAIIRLALGPSTTVGEAIGHGARRFPYALGALIILILMLILVLIPFVVVLAVTGGADFARMSAGTPPTGSQLMVILLMTLVVFAISVRFSLISPVASAEAIGPWAIVKRAWGLARGHYWRLLGLVLLLLIAAIALLATAGIVGGLLARMISSDITPYSAAALIMALVGGVAQGAFSVLGSVMLARVYAQLAGGGAEASVPSSGT
jgi:hypothetical protein